MREGGWGSRDREKKAGDPRRPEAKWLQLMYKIKKSFSFLALVCGTLCGDHCGGTCASF